MPPQPKPDNLIQLSLANLKDSKPQDTQKEKYRFGTLKLFAKKQTHNGVTDYFWFLSFRFKLKDISQFLHAWYVGNQILTHEQVNAILEDIGNKFHLRKGGSFKHGLRRETKVQAVREGIAPATERAKQIVDDWLTKELNIYSVITEIEERANNKKDKTQKSRAGSPTVDFFWGQYVKYSTEHANNGRGWKANTVDKKTNKYQNWIKPWFGNKKLNEVKAKDIEEWVVEMKAKEKPNGGKRLSMNTIRYNFAMLRSIFAYATRLDKQDQHERKPQRRLNGLNPFDLIHNPPKEAPKDPYRKTYTEDELLRIVSHAEVHDTTLVPLLSLSIETGMRIGELRGLRWTHIRWKKERKNGVWSYGVINIQEAIHSDTEKVTKPKVGITRQVGLTENIYYLLINWAKLAPKPGSGMAPVIQVTHADHNGKKRKAWRQWGEIGGRIDMHTDPKGLVFCEPDGTPFKYQSWLGRLNKTLEAVELKRPNKAWHEFRHGFISHCVNAGLDIKWIQRTVGHTDLKTTLGYMQTTKYDPSKIAQALDGISQLRKRKRNNAAKKRRREKAAREGKMVSDKDVD